MLGLIIAVGLTLSSASDATAQGCANGSVRAQEPYGSRLPDCRAYEQVTPAEKNGANPAGETPFVAASTDGGRIVFLVPAGLPGAAGEGEYPSFLAERSSTGWADQGVLPATSPGQTPILLGWSEDLATTLLEVPTGANGLALRDSATGRFTPSAEHGFGYHMAAISADRSRFIFESSVQLLPDAAPEEVTNLYEWNANKPTGEQLTLAGVLPDGSTPSEGSFAGPYEWTSSIPSSTGGASSHMYTQNTMSADGTRVVFTTAGKKLPSAKQLYVRENGTSTVHVSASQRGEPDPNGAKPAAFMAASTDATHILFTSCQKLTNDSTAVSTAAPECVTPEQGQDLYSYDVPTGALSDLTNVSLVDPGTAGATHGAAVQGVLGTSADGAYVYFAANGVLAAGATPGSCVGVRNESSGIPLECNVYLWHNGAISFVARQRAFARDESVSDALNWRPIEQIANGTFSKTSRVSSDGRVLLFRSKERLTAFDNESASAGACDPTTPPRGEPCSELYRYDAGTGQTTCVSCNSSGAAPIGNATLQDKEILATAPPSPAAILPRNLSNDGNRVFFESPEALVANDTNGQQDVYEWESNGTGSCQQAEGCLSLLSSGQSADPSYFADASATGNDAFIFTSQQLVGQDQDQNVDVYDARVEGGISAQNTLPTLPCAGDPCRNVSTPAPTFGVPSSQVFAGAGNLAPTVTPSKPQSKPLTRAQKLARALKACHLRRNRHRRASCKAQARRRYGPVHRHVSNGRSR